MESRFKFLTFNLPSFHLSYRTRAYWNCIHHYRIIYVIKAQISNIHYFWQKKRVTFITIIGTKFISHYYQKALSLCLALPWTLSKRLKCFVFFNARQWLFASSNAMQYLNPTYTGKILFSCLVPSLMMAYDTSSSFYFVILVKWSSISSADDIVNCGFAFLTIQTCKW